MRVIAGTARSIPLFTVKAQSTRPMTDRVKTSLFAILEPHLRGVVVADLFAGTGSMGIEALSRGSARCTFVEQDRICQRTIRRNLERTRLADRAKILGMDVGKGVRRMIGDGERPALVLFDPPFRMGKGKGRERLCALAELIGSELLADGGLLVYHHESDAEGGLEAPSLRLADQRTYGRNVATIFRRKPESDEQ